MNHEPCTMWDRSELVRALARNEFVAHYQPKVDLRTNLPVSVEVLARWSHPSKGLLPPSSFIGTVEDTGLIGELTHVLARQAFAAASDPVFRHHDLGFAINVSPLSLQSNETACALCGMADQFQIAPRRITIEITETATCGDAKCMQDALQMLRNKGFNISADDFGIGYSSLSELNRMPFNEIKIDRAFVSGISHNRKSEAILESIMALAKKLSMHTVAEGIETEQEMRFMKALGCTVGQGFLFAHAMSRSQLKRYVVHAFKRVAAAKYTKVASMRGCLGWSAMSGERLAKLFQHRPHFHAPLATALDMA